jgi:hypothetical protein
MSLQKYIVELAAFACFNTSENLRFEEFRHPRSPPKAAEHTAADVAQRSG